MQNNKPGSILFVIITFFLGGLISPILIHKGLINAIFFSFRFIELMRLLVMLFLGFYVAYWVSLKTNSIYKRKDLCLKLIDEGIFLLSKQKNITINFVQRNDKKQGNLVLNGFKRLSNKVRSIDLICKKIGNDIPTQSLVESFIELKSQFGDSYLSGYDEPTKQKLIRLFDNYEKLFDDLRLEIIT